jgi:zinc protease
MKLQKALALLLVLFSLCLPVVPQKSSAPAFKVDFQKFTLPNGLDVIFHIDRSDPVVAVNLTAHVGSAREKKGRTGFAHLFEHLLFLDSENLGKGGLDRLSTRIGGSGANGSTGRDLTDYLQTVPKDALEKMLWAEADKLGWFINTLTDEVVATEKQVVKNEKRLRVDNEPYGHTQYVIDRAACSEDHPYSWQVIGSLEDLENSTLADVKEFYRRWYVPNNATLVVAGDFDPVQAKAWVEKYFGEIKRGPDVSAQEKRGCVIGPNIRLYHEDNFARVPELTYAWTTAERFHPDSYALDILTDYLANGKRAPFYKVLVEEKKLAPSVEMYDSPNELAGQAQLVVRAFNDKDLDEVAAAINEAFARFEREGISEKDLNRIKAGQERAFYSTLSSVLGKSAQLAAGEIYANDPGIIARDIERTMAVTAADVMRVYNTYIKGKNFVATSFVPKGQTSLALQGSKKADIVEEKIVAGAETVPETGGKREFERTPSSFDRTVEPPYGAAPEVKVPAVWEQSFANGMRVYGIENNEVPLVQFNITIDGGQLLETVDKAGVSNLLAEMMTQGTQKKTPQELEEAIQQLGAAIEVSAGDEEIVVAVSTLARNYDATLALVEEILLEPRWDAKEFDLIKQSALSSIRQQEGTPVAIAPIKFGELMYGKNDIRSRSILGTTESVSAITLDDLKAFYARAISPSVSRLHFVSSLDKGKIAGSLKKLEQRWAAKKVVIPAHPTPAAPQKSTVYFYDVPDAKQTVVIFGYPALAATDKDYYPATVMNYILGGGGFASRLTLQLREAKGYTYGIRSGFAGSTTPGPFTVSSSIRTNVTLEAAQLAKEIMETYGSTYTMQDLEVTKSAMTKSQARAFETAGAKLGMLDNISRFGWKPTYVKDRERIIQAMTIDEVKSLAGKYIRPNGMIWLFVGDAKTQLSRLKALGFGDPLVISK